MKTFVIFFLVVTAFVASTFAKSLVGSQDDLDIDHDTYQAINGKPDLESQDETPEDVSAKQLPYDVTEAISSPSETAEPLTEKIPSEESIEEAPVPQESPVPEEFASAEETNQKINETVGKMEDKFYDLFKYESDLDEVISVFFSANPKKQYEHLQYIRNILTTPGQHPHKAYAQRVKDAAQARLDAILNEIKYPYYVSVCDYAEALFRKNMGEDIENKSLKNLVSYLESYHQEMEAEKANAAQNVQNPAQTSSDNAFETVEDRNIDKTQNPQSENISFQSMQI